MLTTLFYGARYVSFIILKHTELGPPVQEVIDAVITEMLTSDGRVVYQELKSFR